MKFSPMVLLTAAVAIAAALTWVVPAGEYMRQADPVTGRALVVPGTYHRVDASPVSPLATFVAIPRGFVAAADVVGVILFVGGAWVLLDRLGALAALIAAVVAASRGRHLWIVPAVALFFAVMGALENMEEEIIPLVPALVALGAGLGVDAVVVVAMSFGAAMVGSAFGPTNPFQAGIALKLAALPPLSAGGLRLAMFAAGFLAWIGWTLRYAVRTRTAEADRSSPAHDVPVPFPRRHLLLFAIVLAPMAAYVYGALKLDWGFNELSGVFLLGAIVAGLVGGLGVAGTAIAYVEGMASLLPAALLVVLARSVSIVLADGRIIDTLLHSLVSALAAMPPVAAELVMIPFHALIHIAVPSVSGHAVLTMPLFVPVADLLGFSRQVPVLAYQTGAGLMELATPTNGALMAVLLAAGVSLQRWLRFAAGGLFLLTLVGIAGIVFAR